MLVRHIGGLDWKVHSPSHFELLHSPFADTPRVHVCFQGRRWMICAEMAGGFIHRRVFVTRDAAMAALAERIQVVA